MERGAFKRMGDMPGERGRGGRGGNWHEDTRVRSSRSSRRSVLYGNR